jgi:Arc/MetJ family transcription regulator
MRTTLDIPEELIEEARQLLGFKSKSDTIILSLKELIRHKRIEELKQMAGSIKLDIDLDSARRRKRPK